jgi:hypothetical protein
MVVAVVVVQSFEYLVEENQLMVVIVLHQIDYLDFVHLNMLVIMMKNSLRVYTLLKAYILWHGSCFHEWLLKWIYKIQSN